MTILLLGATGRTGIHLLAALENGGHTVHALVRDRNKVGTPGNNTVLFEGIPTGKVALAAAMTGCDAIISILNISRTSDFPWAKLRTPGTFLSDSIKAIIEIATQQKIRRIIVCSAWGTNETKEDIPGWFRWLINHSNIGVAYKDHELQEKYLQESSFDYTIVRPTGLANSTADRPIQTTISNSPKPKLTISRKNVAAFMVQVLHDNTFIRQAVTISEQ